MSTQLNQIQDTPRTVGRAVMCHHSRAVGRSLFYNHARAVARSLSFNHSPAVAWAMCSYDAVAAAPRG